MRCLSMDSQFCEAVVSSGYLTQEQMLHAACHYRLGASRQGGVIFWQIDQEGRVHDGKVMYYLPDCHRNKAHKPTWVSYSGNTSSVKGVQHWGQTPLSSKVKSEK